MSFRASIVFPLTRCFFTMILAIESSCDESALALFEPGKGIRAEWVHSQIALHSDYGGVVPDLAGREHLHHFPSLVREAEKRLADCRVERIAVTYGPGLAGCLALGIALAKGLALFWQVPLCGVNHLRGHAFSPFISLYEESPENFSERFQALLPHLGLLVSGGNTLLFTISKQGKLSIIAQTVDDAAGEALDKGAKLLGLAYPGGPLIERHALKGDPKAYDFPRAFYDKSTLKFSFSGLKTSLRYRLEAMSDADWLAALPELCASYQEAVVTALERKTEQALKHQRFASLGLSGGVANNRRLQTVFQESAERNRLPLYIAQPSHTGDNAAMIAFAAQIDEAGTMACKNWDLSFSPALGIEGH